MQYKIAHKQVRLIKKNIITRNVKARRRNIAHAAKINGECRDAAADDFEIETTAAWIHCVEDISDNE